MDHPEMSPGAEPATNNELQGLYELAEGWLMRYGVNSHAIGTKILGWHEGIPIVDEQPLFSYLLTEKEARVISDDACETLRLGGKLEMSFGNECYIRNPEDPDEPYYEYPILMFRAERAEGEPIAASTLSIEMKDGLPVSHRTNEENANIRHQPDNSIDDAFVELTERLKLEDMTGFNNLTKDEVKALQALLEGVIANPPVKPPLK